MKRLLFVTNLFPRPDLPRCGVFNAHFASALARALDVMSSGFRVPGSEVGGQRSEGGTQNSELRTLKVLVPVPEWNLEKHAQIRAWSPPPEIRAFLSPNMSVHYVPVFYIPIIGRSLSHFFYQRAFQRYQSLFSECDAVLGSWLYPDCVAAAAAAKRAGKPFWARLHGTDRFHLDAKFRGAACHRALDMAEGVFVNAEFMRQELADRVIEVDKIAVVRNGVDRDLFRLQGRVDRGELTVESGDLASNTPHSTPNESYGWGICLRLRGRMLRCRRLLFLIILPIIILPILQIFSSF